MSLPISYDDFLRSNGLLDQNFGTVVITPQGGPWHYWAQNVDILASSGGSSANCGGGLNYCIWAFSMTGDSVIFYLYTIFQLDAQKFIPFQSLDYIWSYWDSYENNGYYNKPASLISQVGNTSFQDSFTYPTANNIPIVHNGSFLLASEGILNVSLTFEVHQIIKGSIDVHLHNLSLVLTPTPPKPNPVGTKLATKQIVGIAIGATAAGILLALGLFMLIRHIKWKRQNSKVA